MQNNHQNTVKPKLETSIVAFLDILGFTQDTMEAFKSSTGEKFLISLHSALTKAYGFLRAGNFFKVKAFTDNIVISQQINEAGLGMQDPQLTLMTILNSIATYQLMLSLEGLFVRGGISVGDFYMDEDIVYGKALLDAYEQEHNFSIYPRVIFCQTTVDCLHKQMNNYWDPSKSPQHSAVLKDFDDKLFLNYLYASTLYPKYKPANIWLKEHKTMVKNKLENYYKEPKIWDKYAWVLNYHNYFCNNNSDIDDSCLIDTSFLERKPKTIF